NLRVDSVPLELRQDVNDPAHHRGKTATRTGLSVSRTNECTGSVQRQRPNTLIELPVYRRPARWRPEEILFDSRQIERADDRAVFLQVCCNGSNRFGTAKVANDGNQQILRFHFLQE